MDLVLDGLRLGRLAIEIKASSAPTLGKGFHFAAADLKPTKTYVAYPGTSRFPVRAGVEAIGLRELMSLLAAHGAVSGSAR
jgi:hypothetical protein